ncbi:hypothetical protein ABE425_04735 [Chryseobacterium cucumeris]|uniref:hypothetical protein n=1 Tax=Chryseobacterium cucumeris TaxID=1813611 RepID=UPI0032094E97
MKELEELTREIREKLPRLIYQDNIVYVDPQTGFSYKYDLTIPQDPMLNDVLEWLTILDVGNITVEFSNQQFSIVKDNGPVDHWDDDDFEGVVWRLSQPFLKDQSTELIKFLHSLIKTKQ